MKSSVEQYNQVVNFLESLQIMPKTMPGLDKIMQALKQTEWYAQIDPQKVIVVAGTNGKGSTCAILEALLREAGQRTGFYSSPHLISTTERIRIGGESISESVFVEIFQDCEILIKSCELSHFEALTLIAGHFFFSKKWQQELDYIIFEVGLGGTYDATNAFPHAYSVITALGLDHTAILGSTLMSVAENKFGIVQKKNTVVHHHLVNEVTALKEKIQNETNSSWFLAESFEYTASQDGQSEIKTKWGTAKLSLLGSRAAENAMTALTLFEKLGFEPKNYLTALSQVKWLGRMQKINWPAVRCPVYLSGDHNPQGMRSLLLILKDFQWKNLYLVVGIGVDKDADEMLGELMQLKNVNLCLTVTPFKGRSLNDYPEKYLKFAKIKNENPIEILNSLKDLVEPTDLVVVTGSLYLVGDVLKAGL